ncbi:hypothetical protein AXF42_Ash017847 [Apostasia shenzhenica]|uniref:FLZ-type domain-containing protein n=1 Tax=Apostasia shenzhenica TaxID=1088818 RepID=A0A2I0A411_9ASPA|nr:hypothetical protein AXF42_Ash017847 [Apostasia shenzhenica]
MDISSTSSLSWTSISSSSSSSSMSDVHSSWGPLPPPTKPSSPQLTAAPVVLFWYGDRGHSGRSEPARSAGKFLQECWRCKRWMGAGMDAFMYGGSAFCSVECRLQQMEIDAAAGG